MMLYKRIHLILITLCISVPIGFAITYTIAVLNGHVAPDFPFISDTGTIPPTSCIFGQLLDFGAVLLFFIVYVRYLHVKKIISNGVVRKKLKIVNKLGFLIGFMSSVGITIVGNFQETNVVDVHFFGAILAFVGLLIYVLIHTFISHVLSDNLYSTKKLFIFRLFLCCFAVSNLIIFIVLSYTSLAKFDGENILLWKPTDKGYVEHVISSTNEWSLAFVVVFVLSTFYKDFKKLIFIQPQIAFKQNS